jgi:hypothetical protein
MAVMIRVSPVLLMALWIFAQNMSAANMLPAKPAEAALFSDAGRASAGRTDAATTSQDSWDALGQLRVGARVVFVDMKLRRKECVFRGYSEQALSLLIDRDEASIQRNEVFSVHILKPTHRGRNTLIGLGIGTAAGALIGLNINTRACEQYFVIGIGMGAGAGLGASFSSSQETIYNAREVRSVSR